MDTLVAKKPSQRLWELLRDSAFASLKEDYATRVAECNLSFSEGKLLRELTEPRSQRELARDLQYDPSNITALADSLEKRGLLERRADASDRRLRLLALTPAGKRLRVQLEARLAEPPAFLNRLTPAEQKQLFELLTKVFDSRPH